MTVNTRAVPDETSQAEALPQLDASSLVDGARLEAVIKEMYRHVARGEHAALHFEVITSTSQRFDPAKRSSTSARDRERMCSARRSWSGSRVASSAWTSRASSSTRRRGFGTARDSGRSSSWRPTWRSFRSPTRASTRSSRTVSSTSRRSSTASSLRALKGRTRRDVQLWAACIAGATPRSSYLAALEANGLELTDLRTNDYRFISGRALDACSAYEVESISLRAARPNLEDGDEGDSR